MAICFNPLIQGINLSDSLFRHTMNNCLPAKAAHSGLIVRTGTKFPFILSQNMFPANLLL